MPKPIKKTDANKAWNQKKVKVQPYQLNSIPIEKYFLIICEGINTEPEYFKSFPIASAKVESYGLGMSREKLVEMVLSIVEDKNNENEENWVIFDMDITPKGHQKQEFNEAIELAKKGGLKVAYANDSFELWFLLHYEYFDTKWTGHEYYKKLSKYWEVNYEKQGKTIAFSKSIYSKLKDDPRANQQQALKRSEKLWKKQKDKIYSERNPCTTIHCLVDELNRHIHKDKFLGVCEEKTK